MPEFLVLAGLPGSGKGTQSTYLEKRHGFVRVSCGDLFRRHVKSGTPFGLKAAGYIAKGELTPDEETSEMFLNELSGRLSDRLVVIEGFPRTLSQAEEFSSFVSRAKSVLLGMLLLQVPKEKLLKRIQARRVCVKCGRAYTLDTTTEPTTQLCPVDGGALDTRSDDRTDIVEHRLHFYQAAEAPVIDFFAARGLVASVNGDGPPDSVSLRVSQGLAELRFRVVS
jgi:adenylate kinase